MGWGVVRGYPLHMCTCMCMHTCAYDIIGNSQGFPHGGCHLQMTLSCLTCICACVCAHVHMWEAPPNHPHPHPTTPHPQSCMEPKTPKFNKSWTNRDNSILFEDSLPLNTPELIQTIVVHPRYPPPTCPTPQSQGNPNRKNYNNFWMKRDNWIPFQDLGPLNPTAHIQTAFDV